MAALGIVSFLVAVVNWGGTDFGRLTTTDMRWPLTGMLLIVAGSQVSLVSFLLSLTRIGENKSSRPTPTTTDAPYART
jgi:uncharacterized membrane protein YhhN